MPVIFSGTLFSDLHASASDVRCFEMTFEISWVFHVSTNMQFLFSGWMNLKFFKVNINKSDTAVVVSDLFMFEIT